MDAFTYAQSQRLIHFACRKWVKAFESSNTGFSYEDLVQEASVVYLKAAKLFDPEMNLSFSTYLLVSLDRLFSSLLGKNSHYNHKSLNVQVESEAIEFELEDTSSNPELECEAGELIENQINSLSPLARLIEEMLIAPPLFVRQEFESINAKRRMASDLGVDERFPPEIDEKFIAKLLNTLGVSQSDLNKARTEIKAMEVACG